MSSKNNDTHNFKLTIEKMSKTGALFDIAKMSSISKETISFMNIDDLVKRIEDWSKKYNNDLYKLIVYDRSKFKAIMSIGRSSENPRKEYERFDQIFDKVKFFYNEYFDSMEFLMPYDEKLVSKVKEAFLTISFKEPEDIWTLKLKELSSSLGFAKNKKEKLELNLDYMFGDFMKIIRILLVKSDNSPSLYEILNILGDNEVRRRLA